MTETVYLKANINNKIEHTTITISDVADIICSKQEIANRIKTLKLGKFEDTSRKVFSITDVYKVILQEYPNVEINNIGEIDFIAQYNVSKPTNKLLSFLKTACVCLILFIGAGFAIMTFNNDVSVKDVFDNIYQSLTGNANKGFTVLEIGYSIGLGLGIIVFYNHIVWKKLSEDPTPTEVEMKLYEDDIDQTIIKTVEAYDKNKSEK